MGRGVGVSARQEQSVELVQPKQQRRIESPSSLKTFRNCRLQYYFEYISKPPVPKTTTIEAFIGNAVHKALEQFRGREDKLQKPTWQDLVYYYDHYWETQYDPQKVRYVRPEDDKDGAYDYGLDCLNNYWNCIRKVNYGTIIARERKVTVELAPGITVCGFVDEVSLIRPKIVQVSDYKTGRSLPTQSELENDPQLPIYQMWVQKEYPQIARKVRLAWHYLHFGETLFLEKTLEQIEDVKQQLIDEIKTIAACNVWEPNESGLCAFCSYQKYCPKKGHAYIVLEKGPDDGFSFATQYGRIADRIRKLNSIKKRLSEEQAALTERIIRYCQENNYSCIIGENGHRVSIGKRGLTYSRKDHSLDAEE
jgi:RecB family exonuclease